MQRLSTILILAALAVPAAALADGEGKDRIGQCERDNQGAKVQPDVLRAYCRCMDRKMGGSVAQSITEWEKEHVKESQDCDIESGWATR